MRGFSHRGPMAGPVRIAGAGLAGMTAALVLARGGRAVEVFDAKTRLLPSSGPHSEGIRNYRKLDALGELRSVGFDLAPFATVQRTVRASPHARTDLLGPAHYLFQRGREAETVDQTLLRLAQEAGASFHFGSALEPGEADIVATGPPKDATQILGAGYTFSAAGSPLRRDVACALFDNEVAPAGYMAITPGIEYHSIYSVSWSEFDYDRLLACLHKGFKVPWVHEILGTSTFVGKIHGRAHFVRDPIAHAERGGALYVGEAGGFQDAVAGFGFRYAAMTGALAARAILQGRDYRGLLTDAFGQEFLDSWTFREKLNHATNDDYDTMFQALGPEITLEAYVAQRGSRGF